METSSKNNNFLNFKNPTIGDIICIKVCNRNIWLYVIGTDTNTKQITVSKILSNFEEMFDNTFKLKIKDNNFIYIGPPESSKLNLDNSLINHSKIVKKNWYNEINFIYKNCELD